MKSIQDRIRNKILKEDRISNKPNINNVYKNHTFLQRTLMLENMSFVYDKVRMDIVDEIFPHPEGPRI